VTVLYRRLWHKGGVLQEANSLLQEDFPSTLGERGIHQPTSNNHRSTSLGSTKVLQAREKRLGTDAVTVLLYEALEPRG